MLRPAAASLAAAVLLPLLHSCGPQPAPAQARNVVLIVADTLRADRLGCYGYPRPTSPGIDSLAARGTLYERCYSQANWTVPSMISLMSGASVCQDDVELPADLEVLAEAVSRHGLATGGFTANAVLRRDRGFERGFDHFSDFSELPAPAIAGRAGEWLDSLSKGPDGRPQRFFLWVQLIDPHAPYAPAPEYDIFSGARPDQAELEPVWRAAGPELADLQPPGGRRELEDSLAYMVEQSNLYDGAVLQTDAGVRMLLEHIERLGVLDETLVIFCSDHGDMLYEHRAQPFFVQASVKGAGDSPVGVEALFVHGHRPWYFEELWNTPLILAGPGFPAGLRRSGLAANLDIYPTVLEAVGARPSRPLEGRSLLGGLDPTRERVHAYGQRTSAMLERDGLKLVLQPRKLFDPDAELGPVEPWLFDLDQGERRELSSERPAEVERLTALIRGWRERHGRDASGVTSAEALEDLRRMGYVGDDPEELVPYGRGPDDQ